MKVDKGIPIPETRGKPRRYPFGDMQVGDSFFTTANPGTLSGAMGYHANKYGGHFTRRAVVENGVKGTRVWRIR